MGDHNFQEFKKDFALLVEAGFVAVKQLDEVSARRIFQAAELINPTSTAPQVGLGYIALNKLELKDAVKTFEKVIEREPENHMAQIFLGICFLLSKPKRERGEKLIREVMKKSTNPTVKNLGATSLEWADKDLKKKNLPFLIAKTQSEEDAILEEVVVEGERGQEAKEVPATATEEKNAVTGNPDLSGKSPKQ